MYARNHIFGKNRRENYFTFALFGFIAAFLLLPTSKAVNNYYYLFLAFPAFVALIIILLKKETEILRINTPEDTMLGILLLWCLTQGIMEASWDYVKHIFYGALFLLSTSRFIDPTPFRSKRFASGLFWTVLVYAFISLALKWISGQYTFGVRINDLISRMRGSYTSVWLVACLALALPHWIRSKRVWEAIPAFIFTFGAISFIFQSRGGIVTFAAFSFFATIIGIRISPRVTLRLLAIAICALIPIFFALDAVNVAVDTSLYGKIDTTVLQGLIQRSDAFRFEIWPKLLLDWQSCGWWQGCGTAFKNKILHNGSIYIASPHTHNIFLAFGFYNGLFALLFFLSSCFFTLKTAWKNHDPWGAYLFTALIGLCFDGSYILGSPDETWLLILLPVGLLASPKPQRDTGEHITS